MRLALPQGAMLMLLGHSLPRFPADLRGRLVQGRKLLVNATGVDLGYDPSLWHQHLCAKDVAGYSLDHWDQSVPKLIAEADAWPEWREARAELEQRGAESPNNSLERPRER